MTILCTDFKMLAADTLTSAGHIKVYNRSKIRIIKGHAIATCGDEEAGFQFEKWFFNQQGETFIGDDTFGVIIANKHTIQLGEVKEDSTELTKLWEPRHKSAMGAPAATAVAEILMKVSKLNAHKAAEHAANYDAYCGPPVYSITKKQIAEIHQDFDGYWIGTYEVPINKVDNYLITQKQWLNT